jgi:hypothetical protein
MDQAAEERIRHEIEDQLSKHPPGAVSRVEWLHYGDAPMIEPGELVPRFVLAEPPGRRRGRRPPETLKAFQNTHGPAFKQVLHELPHRWPEIRRIEIRFENDSGHSRGGMIHALDGQAKAADGDVTQVMVRLKPAELETVDTLITAGIANSRAEAIRWALARISERPAYAQIREHTRDIERLKAEF